MFKCIHTMVNTYIIYRGGYIGDHCIWPGNKLKSNEFKLAIMIHILDFESAY